GFGEGQTYLGSRGLHTDATGHATFSFTPPSPVAAGEVITATATDPLGNTSEFSAVARVVVNQPPAIDPIADRTTDEGSLVTFTATAQDSDAPLTFSLDAGAPDGAAIDPATGLFAWTPSEVQGPGTYSLTVRVADTATPSLGATRTFSVTV